MAGESAILDANDRWSKTVHADFRTLTRQHRGGHRGGGRFAGTRRTSRQGKGREEGGGEGRYRIKGAEDEGWRECFASEAKH